MLGRYRVKIEWKATYQDPIVLERGGEVWLTGKSDHWDSHLWVWAINQSGKEGWIPSTLVRADADKHYANAAFSAMELTCAVGDDLLAIDETHGWILCAAINGSKGWVPARNLEPI